MGFTNNTSYILDAVLTKKGREYLSKGSGNFNITKFALADDEIDYTLWNHAHPQGSDFYGAVLEATPMIEPCVDPEVVMKYKLINLPIGTLTLPYIENVIQIIGDSKLKTILTDDGWTLTDVALNPVTVGASGAFSSENYSFLVLNKNVVDIGTDQGENVNFTVGAIYNEETGRLSKKVISRVATIRTQTLTFNRETSIIITGQMSGAVYVLPVAVNYVNNTP